jgi:hypothetical protein
MPSHTEQNPPLPWSAFLDELDQAISEPIELHCIGGFVVSLLYGLPRPTGDVDYVAAIPRYRTEELEQLALERIKTRSKVQGSPTACHRGNHAGGL